MRSSILFCLLSLITESSAPAASSRVGRDFLGAPALSLDPTDFKKSSFKAIRVKIFPHERGFPPHFEDRVDDQFRIESDGEDCSVYEANFDGEKTLKGRFISRARVFELYAKTLRQPIWFSCGGSFWLIRKGGERSFAYQGEMIVGADEKIKGNRKSRHLVAVLRLSLEEYLRGVVPGEVNASWPDETLKSQAVAARTYALYHILQARKFFPDRIFDVDDSVVYQAFTGIVNQHPRTDVAIAQTKGEVIVYGDRVIQAYYHADSGGITAAAGHAFLKDVPFCKSKREPYDPRMVTSEWNYLLSRADLLRKLRARGLILPGKNIAAIRVPADQRFESGHAHHIEVLGQDGERSLIAVNDFKRAVNLPSTWFHINHLPESDEFMFIGRGSGHGVGMNQTGARVLAEHFSWDYQKILNFYYTGTKVVRMGGANL